VVRRQVTRDDGQDKNPNAEQMPDSELARFERSSGASHVIFALLNFVVC